MPANDFMGLIHWGTRKVLMRYCIIFCLKYYISGSSHQAGILSVYIEMLNNRRSLSSYYSFSMHLIVIKLFERLCVNNPGRHI